MRSRIIILITVLNALLLFGAIVCIIRISEHNRSINSVTPPFEYTETGDAVHLSTADRGTVILKFSTGGVSIEDSHLYDNPESIAEILMFARYYAEKLGYEFARSNIELIGEYRLHTILYHIGYKPEQTGTLNWDYADDPRWYVNTVSSALGALGI